MIPISGELFITFLVAITILSITPGADTMLVIRNAARGGWRDGVVSSFGVCCGLFAHATLSAVGISVILLQAAWAFTALKYCGAAYLVWLGLSNWRNIVRPIQPVDRAAIPVAIFSPARSFREGVLSNTLNPKTALFYLAFLPQFIAPEHSAIIQSLILAAIHFFIAMLWQSLLAIVVEKGKTLFNSSRLRHLFDGLAGSVMIWLGWKVASEG